MDLPDGCVSSLYREWVVVGLCQGDLVSGCWAVGLGLHDTYREALNLLPIELDI